MIIYLVLSILSSTGLLIILKSFVKWKVDTLHGIIFNYWTAALLSFLMINKKENNWLSSMVEILPATFIIGALFISVFFIIAKTTHVSGVGVTSVASKMSMVIPITAGFFLYNESVTVQKISGILLAIPAVLLTSISKEESGEKKFSTRKLFLPVILFFGSGLVDTAIKFTQHHYMNGDNQQVIIMAIFASAGAIGTFRLLYEVLILKKQLHLVSIGAGILLGVVNYFSLYYLLKCLDYPGSESSNVFALVNTGIVISSFVAGLLLFKEKAEKSKNAGVVLALLAIIILSYNFN
jgi:drug/metabolite transporter (DMT)-like permease